MRRRLAMVKQAVKRRVAPADVLVLATRVHTAKYTALLAVRRRHIPGASARRAANGGVHQAYQLPKGQTNTEGIQRSVLDLQQSSSRSQTVLPTTSESSRA